MCTLRSYQSLYGEQEAEEQITVELWLAKRDLSDYEKLEDKSTNLVAEGVKKAYGVNLQNWMSSSTRLFELQVLEDMLRKELDNIHQCIRRCDSGLKEGISMLASKEYCKDLT